jgi:hypothetical protein
VNFVVVDVIERFVAVNLFAVVVAVVYSPLKGIMMVTEQEQTEESFVK